MLNVWVASFDSTYGGTLPLSKDFAVIIAVDKGVSENIASNVLVSTMLHDISAIEHGRIKVVSCRPEGAVSLIEKEVIVNRNVTSRSIIDIAMRAQPDIMIFDALFPFKETDFKGQICPSQIGYQVFYLIPASGDNEEELRDSAIKGYLNLTKQKDLGFVDRIIVTKTNDLDAENPFRVTEFLFQ